METTIRKWGNSPAVRLPAAILREAAFGVEQRVHLGVSGQDCDRAIGAG